MPKYNKIINTTLLLIILFSIITAIITIAIASIILPPTDDFERSNPYWNGLKIFSETINATFIDVTTQQLNPETTVLFIIGPSENITQQRIEYWKKYAENGGTLVIMDETGIINNALSNFNINIRINGHLLLDPVFYYKSWKIPKITDITETSITKNITAIATNLPSALNITMTHNIKILAKSSPFSFLDLKGNYEPAPESPSGPFPIAAETSYGKGQIIIFSDSDLFINSMITLADNLQLLKNIAQNKKAIIDTGVWKKSTQTIFRNIILTIYSILLIPEIKYTITILTITTIYILINKQKPKKIIDEIQEILKKHPDWDKNLLQTLKEIREKQLS
jgi:hypothetical protein